MAADIYPIPFSTLLWRMHQELERDAMYTLQRRLWWTPKEGTDVSFTHFGQKIATPLGPASGPHTQLAQNLVLAWLGGSRFMELKTVQILDDLEIPRPCIHVPHIGYNVEWSQELPVLQSAREYAKGWFLIHLLASKKPELWPAPEMMFDTSVGYDLKGIRSEKVANYLRSMKDASTLLKELRSEIPEELKEWADIEVPTQISNSVTISTFHGCPADEIEAIASHLLEEYGFHTVIKLNPTLLGYEQVTDIINNRLGYEHIQLSSKPFEEDLKWDQMMDMLPRLRKQAEQKGVGFGVKFSNTLVMQSDEPPFEAGQDMYMSGPPLHVLALLLAEQFSQATKGEIPITFSAGLDAKNFPDMVAAGIGPLTTCSDILKARGYGRLYKYLRNLEQKMEKLGAIDLEQYKQKVNGVEDAVASAQQTLTNLASSVQNAPQYNHKKNSKAPKKVETQLEIFDCLTCDKCIPVCPNVANFAFPVPSGTYTPGKVKWDGEKFELSEGESLIIDRKHQIGNTVEACNLCGHCDTWCPELGGPYLSKPNLYLHRSTFEAHPERDGFLIGNRFNSIKWRRAGEIYHYQQETNGSESITMPDGSRLWIKEDKPIKSQGSGEIDLTILLSMKIILTGLTAEEAQVWLPPQKLYTQQNSN